MLKREERRGESGLRGRKEWSGGGVCGVVVIIKWRFDEMSTRPGTVAAKMDGWRKLVH